MEEEIKNGIPAEVIIEDDQDALMSFNTDNVLALADRADKMVSALNRIMAAAIKITTEKDWVLISGTPYLQESGATKVARLFGISWKIHNGYPVIERDGTGYPTYTYRMSFSLCGTTIDADGSRNARDEFFAGAKTDRSGNPKEQKTVDQIDLSDVKRAAYTNCLNNGIKRILPGLRNLDVKDLEAAGMRTSAIKGYVFKEGSKGGSSGKAEDSGIVCQKCGAAITQAEASYSQAKYGFKLCRSCQKKAAAVQTKAAKEELPITLDADDDLPEVLR